MRGMTDVDGAVDVLVVGLGPAGATAAAAAARSGARVAAIDRRRQAGVPVQCAEFVPGLIGQEVAALGLAQRQSIRAMSTFVESATPHHRPDFPGVMIDRAVFDAALVRQAEDAGAQCWFGVSLRTLEADGAAALSDGSRLTARVVIGADGPHSLVGRAVGRVNTAMAETRQMTVPLLDPFTDTDIFLSADLKGGYAWLFPKADVANLGLGGDPAERHRFKPLLDDLHAQLVAHGRVGRNPISYTGGAIPVGGMLDPVGARGDTLVLLAGDAAGLTNPITGAGIASAVMSGRMAGEAAARAASGCATAAGDYRDELGDLLRSSLDRALRRRGELLASYANRARPTADALRRSWIAFPEYWAA